MTPAPDPCPFCGGPADVVMRDHFAYVVCNEPSCGARGPFSCMRSGPDWRDVVEDSAVWKWNDRVPRVVKQ